MARSRIAALGTLEEQVMQIVWGAGPLPVREVVNRLGNRLAYTTVMTTLDRLHRKGLLARDKDGTAFVYRPAMTRDEYHRRLVEDTVGRLLQKSADPVLAGFIDAAAAIDEDHLRRLEQLIAARRKGRR
jgi:predicted transcriptional regulator